LKVLKKRELMLSGSDKISTKFVNFNRFINQILNISFFIKCINSSKFDRQKVKFVALNLDFKMNNYFRLQNER
jgi:hypothetical protein